MLVKACKLSRWSSLHRSREVVLSTLYPISSKQLASPRTSRPPSSQNWPSTEPGLHSRFSCYRCWCTLGTQRKPLSTVAISAFRTLSLRAPMGLLWLGFHERRSQNLRSICFIDRSLYHTGLDVCASPQRVSV